MANAFHFKAEDLRRKKSPEELGLAYTSVQRIELRGSFSLETRHEEICLAVIWGEAEYHCEGLRGGAASRDMIYIPRGKSVTLRSHDGVVIAFGAPAERDTRPVHIEFAEIDRNPNTHRTFGRMENNTRRDVWNFIDADFDCCRLMMGLCSGSPGGWTAWPPHEHAAKREEVYFYFDMGNAFGIQCVYDDMDHPYMVAMVREGDLISIPRGYHPNVGCPGGRISYVYCMVAKKPGDRKFLDLSFQQIYGDKFE